MKLGSFESEMTAHECVRLENSYSFFIKNTKYPADTYAILLWTSGGEKIHLNMQKTKNGSDIICCTSFLFIK